MIKLNIILTCYQRPNIVQQALESILKQYALENIVLTFVNDCSPNTEDNYQNLISQYKHKIDLRYIKTPENRGPGYSRSMGLQHCNEDYVMFLDDDDILYNENTIQKYLQHLSDRRDVGLIFGGYQKRCEDKIINITPQFNSSLHGLVFNNHLIKKYNLDFDHDLRYDEDCLFLSSYTKAVKRAKYQYIFLEETNLSYVQNINNYSLTAYNNSAEQRMYFLMSKIKQLKFLLKLNDEDYYEEFINLLVDLYLLFYPILYYITEEEFNYLISKKLQEQFLLETDYLVFLFDTFSNLISKKLETIYLIHYQNLLNTFNLIKSPTIFNYNYYKDKLTDKLSNDKILLNIIIPCYYESERIDKCLQSLNEQTKIQLCQIILINDCSPNTSCNYEDILQKYKNMNIKYLKTTINSGPGKCRQMGLENINNNAEYIMFIDDDDCLDNPLVIENYLKILYLNNNSEKEKIALLAAKRVDTDGIVETPSGYCGLTGSLFYYPIIQMFNITFPEFKYEEDTLFYEFFTSYLRILNKSLNNNICFLQKEVDDFVAYKYTTNNINSLTSQQNYLSKDVAFSWILIIVNICKFYKQQQFYKYYSSTFKEDFQEYYGIVLFFSQYLLHQNYPCDVYKQLYQDINEILIVLKLFNCDLDLQYIQMFLNNFKLNYNFTYNENLCPLEVFEQNYLLKIKHKGEYNA